MKILIAVVSAALLVSCQTKEVSEMNYSEVKKLAAQKNQECAAQGVRPGTKEMELCVTHELNREASVRKNHNARLRAAANSTTFCQPFGNTVTCF